MHIVTIVLLLIVPVMIIASIILVVAPFSGASSLVSVVDRGT